MRIPRMTIRRVMAIVAVASLPLWGQSLWRRSSALRSKAEESRALCYAVEAFGVGPVKADNDAWRAWHAAVWRKYDHAARNPWLPLPHDPPRPPEPAPYAAGWR